MPRRKPSFWLLMAATGGLLYPFFVYCGMQHLPPFILIVAALGLIALRLYALRSSPDFKLWCSVFGIAALLLSGAALIDPRYATQAYPVLISLSVASAFGISLLFPPTIVERIAHLSEPDFPPEGVVYTRRVTITWVVFLILNAAISASLAVWGNLGQWTLWNGLISYILMGVLFAAEYMVRRRVRR